MMDKKKIVARIDELMREKHITSYELRENAEISTTVYQWSIEKICDYLGVSLAYFFSFEHDDQTDVQNSELYRAIVSLTDGQKNAVCEIIEQFKKANERE